MARFGRGSSRGVPGELGIFTIVRQFLRSSRRRHAGRSNAQTLFSRSTGLTNREILESGSHLPLDMETVRRYADLAEVDLSHARIDIARSADDIGYFDYLQARASTNGDHILLAPSAFENEEQLVRTVAHEVHHVNQWRDGRITGTEAIGEMEDEAYGIEDRFVDNWHRNRR